MWESSRMMLPEHRERIVEQRKQLNQKQRPDMDSQAMEEYGRLLAASAQTGLTITIAVYDPYEDIEVTGRVVQANGRRILFAHDGIKTWVPLESIVEVRSPGY
jgi:hypothetical protein